jgi:hypothetical protein
VGIFDSSSSSTQNFTENRDHRLVLDNQAQGISGDNNALTVSITSTDMGTVQGALDASAKAILENSGLARETVAAIAGVNRDSLSFAQLVNRDSMDLAARGQSMIATSAADSLNMVGNVVDLAFKANEAQSKRLSDTGMTAVSQVARAYDTANGYQAEKQTADSKYMVVAGLIVVAVVAIKAFS